MSESRLPKLLQTRVVLGTFVKLPRPEIVELLALSGLDFLVCDTEHAQMSETEVRTVLLAGRAANIPVLVRLPSLDHGVVNRLLEAGAAGVQLSGVTSKQQVDALREACLYPPQGRRGVSTAQPVAGYGRVPVRDFMAANNSNVLCVGQLESSEYDDDLSVICSPLDVAFIGPMDLSVDLGVPGDLHHPRVLEAVERLRLEGAAAGTRMGIFAPTAADAQASIKAGFRYVVVGSDLALFSNAASSLTRELLPEVAS